MPKFDHDLWEMADNTRTPLEIIDILLQVLEGLKVLHNCNIIHRNLNLKNIVFSKNKQRKNVYAIGNLGFARKLEEGHTIGVDIPLVGLFQDPWSMKKVFKNILKKLTYILLE